MPTKSRKKHLQGTQEALCQPTAPALQNGAYVCKNGCCFWWLRSAGNVSFYRARVFWDGRINYDGQDPYFCSSLVRPAMWIKL